MRKQWMFTVLLLIGMSIFSSSLGAQQGNPPTQAGPGRGAAPQGAGRGPAPPVPGPPHDPHDLAGVWNARRGYGLNSFDQQGPAMTAWGQQQFKAAKASNGGEFTLETTNDPVITKCLPPGTPRIYLQPFPLQIVQTPNQVIMLFEYDHSVRHIFTDGRKHPEDITPTYMGDSIGHWEGDILVVDTTGFNERTWLDRVGHAHSDQLHVVERFHRLDQNNLDIDITMEDPKAMTKPWTVHYGFALHADWNIMEQVCTDNGDFLKFEK
jgi:hypothetical protein